MSLKQKIKKIMDDNGISTEIQLAGILDLNYVVFNRNVKADKLTGDMIMAFANSETIKVDLNYLAREVNSKIMQVEEQPIDYSLSDEDKIDQAIKLLKEVKESVKNR